MSKKINVLHISNDFPNSSLYEQLVLHLDKFDIEQIIYSAVRSNKEATFNPSELSHISFFINNILSWHDRILFRLKVRKIYNDLYEHIDISNIDLIHAHTLYSDGAVALKLKESFDIPYIVSVRNTAINAFGKYRPDLKWRKNRILSEAEKIVFLSPAYQKKLFLSVNTRIRESIKDNFFIIPNGIAPLFLNNKSIREKNKPNLKLLFVGQFIKLKNIPNIIEATAKLRGEFDVTLTLVGKGNERELVRKLIDSKPYVNYLGFIKDKRSLRSIYQSHDIFVMVSKPETFGLVYIEALSQGLPIIHTKGEGIDGYFEGGNISEAVEDPADINEIAKKIELLANRLDSKLKQKCIVEAQKFDWTLIAKRYRTLYANTLKGDN